MPGEEGYPAYLSSKVSAFYERAGRVFCLGTPAREGSLTVVGAVSPAGGDLSEPVVQATLRVVKVFWSLEDKLAYARHFPAISWLRSYSLYDETIDEYLKNQVDKNFPTLKKEAMKILEKEDELEEIVRLVGLDSLSSQDRLTMKIAMIIRSDFLHQNAFNPKDTYTSIHKQFLILDTILYYHLKLAEAIGTGRNFADFEEMQVEVEIARARLVAEESRQSIAELKDKIDLEIAQRITTPPEAGKNQYS
jgi:V/A-type H+-transporting ATPase subunit A